MDKSDHTAIGEHAERLCIKQLKAAGYDVQHVGQTAGPWDVIASDRKDLILIQVKSTERAFSSDTAAGNRYLDEIKRMAAWKVPGCGVSKELWVYGAGKWHICPVRR